jgi:hypothetical protein
MSHLSTYSMYLRHDTTRCRYYRYYSSLTYARTCTVPISCLPAPRLLSVVLFSVYFSLTSVIFFIICMYFSYQVSASPLLYVYIHFFLPISFRSHSLISHRIYNFIYLSPSSIMHNSLIHSPSRASVKKYKRLLETHLGRTFNSASCTFSAFKFLFQR